MTDWDKLLAEPGFDIALIERNDEGEEEARSDFGYEYDDAMMACSVERGSRYRLAVRATVGSGYPGGTDGPWHPITDWFNPFDDDWSTPPKEGDNR